MRLIDADTIYEQTAEWEAQALEQVNKYNYKDSREEWIWWSAVLTERTAFKYDIFNAPTIEAVPVLKGKNLKEGWSSLFECSKCGESCSDTYVLDHNVINFCPHCGAKIDGATE